MHTVVHYLFTSLARVRTCISAFELGNRELSTHRSTNSLPDDLQGDQLESYNFAL